MRTYYFPLAAVLALAIAFPSLAAEKPRPAQGNQNQSKKVWTNEDLDQLHSQGLISIVGPDVTAPATPSAAAAAVAPAEPSSPAYSSRLEDPDWYAKKAADLQSELDKRHADLQAAQTAIADSADRVTQPGIALDKPTIAVTPQAAVALLEAQVEEVQNQLDELSDLARQNGIPPGDLRS